MRKSRVFCAPFNILAFAPALAGRPPVNKIRQTRKIPGFIGYAIGDIFVSSVINFHNYSHTPVSIKSPGYPSPQKKGMVFVVSGHRHDIDYRMFLINMGRIESSNCYAAQAFKCEGRTIDG